MYLNREKFVKAGLLLGVIILCSLAIILILNSVKQLKSAAAVVNFNQVSELSHSLVKQQAKQFSPMLVQNVRAEEYSDILEQFTQEEFVLDASLYAVNGVLIAQSSPSLDLKESLISGSEQERLTRQIVEPIYAQQNLVGFLRVTVDLRYNEHSQTKVDGLFRLLYGEMIIFLLIGAIIASSVHHFLFKRQTYHPVVSPKPISQKKQTQRFHSRRRALGRK